MAFSPALATGIIFIYFIVTLGIGLWAWRRGDSGTIEHFLLGNRRMRWFVGFFSLVATFFSAATMIAWVGLYYKFGVASLIGVVGRFAILYGAVYYFLAPKIWRLGRRFGHTTPSDLVRDYFDSEALGYIVAATLILAMVPFLFLQFAGVGIILEMATEGLVSVTLGSLLIGAVIAIYTFLGGMRSVAWTDTLQGLMLIGGTFGGGLVLIMTVGGGFGTAFDTITQQSPGLFTIPDPTGQWTFPYLTSWIIAFSVGALIWPQIWTRIHYFKDVEKVRNMSWMLPAIFWLTQIGGFFAVLSGAVAIPNAAPDQFLLLLYKQFFSTVIFALIASAGLAAMMSSAGSICLGIGTIATSDLSQRLRPDWGDRKHLTVARVVTILSISVALLLTQVNISFLASLAVASAAIALSTIFPQIFAALRGWTWPTSEAAVVASIAGGVITATFLALPWINHPFGINGGFYGLAANVVLFVGLSFVTDGTPDEDMVEEWEEVYKADAKDLDREYRERIGTKEE